MDWLADWYDWVMAVVHKPLGAITLSELAGLFGSVLAVLAAIALYVAILASGKKR